MRRPAVHESGSGKSSAQPDGGEGLAKCKGYRREAVSEGSIEQTRESMDKNRIQGASVGRAGNVPRSPYPSKMRSVDSATVRGRRLRLPQEICPVSLRRLRMPRGTLTEPAKPTPNLYERASFAGLDPARGKGHTKLVWLITIQPLSQSGFDFGAGLSSTPCV